MAGTAELGADDVILASDDGPEPHRDHCSRNGVLAHAHVLEREAVDDVLRGEVDDDGLAVDEMHFVFGNDIVLASGIVGIKAERVRAIEEAGVNAAENAVCSGVVEIPRKLLADGADAHGIGLGWKLVAGHAFAPKREAETEEEHGLDEHDAEFEVGGGFALHAVVVGFRVPRFVKAEDGVKEIADPANEKEGHEPVAELEQVIDGAAVLGGIRQDSEGFVDAEHRVTSGLRFAMRTGKIRRAAGVASWRAS